MWPGYTLDSPRPYSWLLCPLGSYRELSHGFLVVWKNETNKEDVWKGKLKVNVSAFLLMGENSIWLPMSLSFPKCRLACDHSMSAVTWVNKTGMMYQVLVPCIHGNDCDILVTSRICKKGTPWGTPNCWLKGIQDEAMNRRTLPTTTHTLSIYISNGQGKC